MLYRRFGSYGVTEAKAGANARATLAELNCLLLQSRSLCCGRGERQCSTLQVAKANASAVQDRYCHNYIRRALAVEVVLDCELDLSLAPIGCGNDLAGPALTARGALVGLVIVLLLFIASFRTSDTCCVVSSRHASMQAIADLDRSQACGLLVSASPRQRHP